jgi:hypothetical protein
MWLVYKPRHINYISTVNTPIVYIYITGQDVKDILQTLKISYACGDDDINHKILKSTSEFICIHLTIIFLFLQLQRGIFPLRWKCVQVLQAFRQDDKNSPSDYRSISLLRCIWNVMKRAVHKHTYFF